MSCFRCYIFMSEQSKPLQKFFYQTYAPLKTQLIIISICAIILGFNGFINSYLLKLMIDALVQFDKNMINTSAILWPAIFICLHMEVYNSCWRVIDVVHTRLHPAIHNSTLTRSFRYLLTQSIQYFQNNHNGSIINHLNTLAEHTEQITNIVFIRIIRGLVQEIVAIVSMYLIHPIFAIALLTWSVFFIWFSLTFSKRLLMLSADYANQQANTYGQVADSVANYQAVKLFASQRYEHSLLATFLIRLTTAYQRKTWYMLKFHYIQGLSISVLIGIMMFVLVQLKIQQRITIGDFSFILGLTLYVTEYMWTLTQYIDRLNDSIGKCKQSIAMLYQPIAIPDKPNAQPLKVTHGKIIFDRVSFQYQNSPTLYQQKSFIIGAKQKVGLVGYTGSGKSTLVKLLLRLHDVTSGDILIDGQSIQQVTLESLYHSIAMIPQEPVLFHRTIEENIRYGLPEASMQQLIEASKIANIHEDILAFPDGYQTLVGERGINLSGGQKQRIALARAIIKNAPIWIFDEATSQLDSLTELAIRRVLESRMDDKTVIVIAHRLAALQHMDRIIVLDNGQIIEDGTHSQLLKARRAYYNFWRSQTQEVTNDSYV